MGGAVKAVAGIAIAGIGIATGLTPLIAIGASLALAGASQILAPKPQDPNLPDLGGGSFAQQQQQRLQTIRSSIAARQIIYGETVVSGPLIAAFSTGTDNEFLHLFIPIAGHEIDSFLTVWIGDTPSTDSKFTGLVRINTHIGTDSQAADSDAVSEIPEWTTAHQGKGIAYLYVRLKWDRDVFISGIPNIKVKARGKKVFDPRDSLTNFSDNPILCQRDFLLNEFKAASGSVDDTLVIAQANVCDEDVSLRVSGSITLFEDVGGGQVRVTSVNHGRSTGAVLKQTGTTNYNDVYTLSNITNDTYEITEAFNGDDATGTWTQAITVVADAGGGEVTVTVPAHRHANNTTVTQAGTTDYNGDFVISEVTADTFKITASFNGSQTGTIEAATQKRYVCNGQLLRNDAPINMIEKLKTSCAGTNARQQGLYKFYAGAFVIPTVSLNEDDLRGEIQIQTKDSRKELYNAVKGEFIDASNNYLPTNFPPLTNSSFETDDGGIQLIKSIELPFTDNAVRAQRIAKITHLKSRQGTKVVFPGKMTAFELAVWDTMKLSIDKLEWTDESFRILSWGLASDGGGVDLQLQEDSAADWAWLSSDELAIPASVDMPVADPNTIGVIPTPTGLTATSRRLEIVLTWDDDEGSNTTGYDIQRADDSGFSTNLVTLATDHGSNLFIDDIGDKATQRYYRIRGRGGAKRTLLSAFTSGVNATTAGIDTDEVVDNAITVEAASSTAGDISSTGTSFVTIETIVLTTGGGPVVVMGKCESFASRVSSFTTFQLFHAASSTVIDEIGVDSLFATSGGDVRVDAGVVAVSVTASLMGVFTPTAATNTIIMRMKNSSATASRARFRAMNGFELKK